MAQQRYHSPTPLHRMNRPAEVLRVVSHPVRLKILELITSGDYNVSELAKATRQPQNAISQHLKEMTLRRVLKRTREGRSVYYKIDDNLVTGLVRLVRQNQQVEQTYYGGEAI